MNGVVEGIYVTPRGSAAMERAEEVRTVEGCGIEGDRYCAGTGFWSRFGDVCEVTLIEGEDLDYIENELGIGVKNGEHRRNIITRGIRLGDLRRKMFRVGEALLEYDRRRPPCRHVGPERARHDEGPQGSRRHLRQGRPGRQHQGKRLHRNGVVFKDKGMWGSGRGTRSRGPVFRNRTSSRSRCGA